MRGWLKVVALAALAAGATAPALAQSTCDRACLTGYVDSYLTALFANDAARAAAGRTRAHHGQRRGEKARRHVLGRRRSKPSTASTSSIPTRGDTGTQTVIRNADGSKTMHMVRLKVLNGAITEIETIRANKARPIDSGTPIA